MSSLQVHIEREARDRVPYTPEQLAQATEVRTRYGWYDVIQVNPDSVTVSGPLWDIRIPHDTILETR